MGKIVLWNLNQGQTLITIANNANFPEWLPCGIKQRRAVL
jgi:hypothetical protein